MQLEQIIAAGQLVPLQFMQADVAASQTDTAMAVAEVRDAAASADDQNAAGSYVIPWPFDVVGVSVRSSAARTNGVLTAEAAINGTETGLQAILDATNTQSHRSTQAREKDRGAAGDRVSATLTTDGDWAPVTADVVVTVWVLVYMEAI